VLNKLIGKQLERSLIPSFSLLYILRPAAGSATRYGNVAREA